MHEFGLVDTQAQPSPDLTIITTTPYPIEIFEEMQFGCSLIFGSMNQVELEDYEFSIEALGGNIVQILLAAPIQDEAYDFEIEALDGDIWVILLATPIQDEAYGFGIAALDGSVTPALVSALMPDEGLSFGCSLISGSMTHV
jgi:hypothetical protein